MIMWFISYDDCRDFEEESQMREIELAPRRFPTLFFQFPKIRYLPVLSLPTCPWY